MEAKLRVDVEPGFLGFGEVIQAPTEVFNLQAIAAHKKKITPVEQLASPY
jgi:hypothetical protein